MQRPAGEGLMGLSALSSRINSDRHQEEKVRSRERAAKVKRPKVILNNEHKGSESS